MKKLLIISIIILTVIACKKTKFSPEGPTDVRVRNLSDLTFEEVIVSTSENAKDIDTLGNISKGAVSEYFRFTKVYPKAEISAKINIGGSMEEFSTDPVNYAYLTYIGQAKITYEVWISDQINKKLELRVLYPLDGPLD